MRTITLKRVAFDDDGTYGVLIYERVPFLLTLERPWRDNQRNVSSIPAGTYAVKRAITPKHGRTWRLEGVPNRSDVLIHVINTEKDSEGCIGVGLQWGRMDVIDPDTLQVESQPAVLFSAKALEKFDGFMGEDEEFRLVIVW